jgi:hypothetical protein
MCYCESVPTAVSSLIPEIPFSPSNPWLLFGSRALKDTGTPEENARLFLYALDKHDFSAPDLIISGGAYGADAAAEALAVKLGVPAVILTVGSPSHDTFSRQDDAPAPWVVEQVAKPRSGPGDSYTGYHLRNCAMAWLTEHWDGGGLGIRVGGSSGTTNMYKWLADHGVTRRLLWDV